MRRIAFVGSCFLAVAATGLVCIGASYAFEPSPATGGPFAPPFPSSSSRTLLESEMAVYVRRGISPARAARAVAAQGAIANAGIVSKVEAALGNAYAGVWFEPSAARLRVGVTSTAGRRQVERIALATGLANLVATTPVRSTWLELLATQRLWKQKLRSLFAREEVETAIDPSNNALDVTLGSATGPSEQARLRREARAAKVNVSVAVAPYGRVGGLTMGRSTACKAFAVSKAYCDKPLTSGVTIQSEVIGGLRGLCTAGPMVIPRATKLGTFLLTAGHCIKEWGGNGKSWYSLERNEAGSLIEIGPAMTHVFSEKGDFGLIQIDEPGPWTSGMVTDPLFAVTAEWGALAPLISYPVKEERLPEVHATSCHEGQKTGQACGEIKAVNVEKVIEGTTVKGLVEVVKLEKAAAEGDSGGPELTMEANGEALIEGIAVAAVELEPTTLFFDPMGTVLKELKKSANPSISAELLTKNNETRPGIKWLKIGEAVTKEEADTTDGEWFLHHKAPALLGGGEITIACAGKLKGDVAPVGADKVTALLGLDGEKENEIACDVSASTNLLCKAGTAVLVKALHLPWVTKLATATIGEEEHIVDNLTAESSTPGWEGTCSTITVSCTTNDRARFVENLTGGAMFELTGELTASCSDGGTSTTTGHEEVLGFTL